MRRYIRAWLAGLVILVGNTVAAEDFPFRDRYPDVPVIDTATLAATLDRYLVIDVRSRYEYDTLHIAGALHLPIGGRHFSTQLKTVHATDPRPMVFYCNGRHCVKSYDAVLQAQAAKLDRVQAYDAGILAWATAHPERTALLGATPADPGRLIDDAAFKARLLTPDAFTARANDRALVLDIRDAAQRDNPLFPLRETRVPLDNTQQLERVIRQAVADNRTLLIYDKTGNQIRWFQYHLEARGARNYYFLAGGSEAWFRDRLGLR